MLCVWAFQGLVGEKLTGTKIQKENYEIEANKF